MMVDVHPASLLLSLVVGFVAGLAYFGGLWWTAKRVTKVKAALPLLAGSFIFRIALLLAVLYLVARGEPAPLVASLVGVWLARKASIAYVERGSNSNGRAEVRD